MSSVEKVNRELARLDTELRAGAIDRASFRAQRRQLLLDFEERETTTQPAAVPARGTETTLVDPEADPTPFLLPEPPSSPACRATDAPPKKKKPVAGIALSAIGAVVVLALAGWWYARPKPEVPATLPESDAIVAGAPVAVADTPQSLAAALIESAWTDADIVDFLARWNRLSVETIQAATEDSRIWLLRAETGRRLRDAREMESLEPSSEFRARVEQLERLQAAVGTP